MAESSAGPEHHPPGGPMVAVCLAPADLRPDVDPLTGTVSVDTRRADLAPAEAAALEYGLRAAERWAGWVLAVAAGPPAIEPLLSEMAALGARPLRVDVPGTHDEGGPRRALPEELAGDPSALAESIATAIRAAGVPQLVVCGDRSAGRGVGAVPAFLAHHLQIGQALGLVSLAFGDTAGEVRGERRLDGGWRERIALRDPAVVSVEAAGVRLRRATLTAVLGEPQAVEVFRVPAPRLPSLRLGPPRPYRPRTKPVPPPEGPTHQRLLELTGALTSREPPRVVGPLSAEEAADELLAYLERHGYL